MPARGETLGHCLLLSAERDEGGYVFHLGDGIVRMSCAQLAEDALRWARRLAARGVEPGDRVGVFGPNRPEWVVSAFATWLAGATLVPIPKPLRVRAPEFVATRTRRALEMADCRHVLVDPALASLLPAEAAIRWDGAGDESREGPSLPQADSAAVIQLTSGSTADPKGSLVTHAAVMAQLDFISPLWLAEDGVRTSVNWTPYFHDLGLFSNGVISPAAWCTHTHHLPTELFASDPTVWLRLLTETGATKTTAPSSAYGAALRAAASSGKRFDLRHVDVAYFGAEGVDPVVVEHMIDGSHGVRFRPDALGSSYGLAEAVLAVTLTRVGDGIRFERVSVRGLAESRADPAGDEPADLLASCGRPGIRTKLRIMGEGGELPERHVGEVQIRGPSLMRGYVGTDAPDPFVDGWLRTGDLGYLAGGELFITGRMKDVVIVLGQNYYPQDFEFAAGAVDGVRPGRCVAFKDEQDERFILLVEPSDECDFPKLARAVRDRVVDAVGVVPGEVAVVPRETVEKTTSGKLRRGHMRTVYSKGRIAVLGSSG